MSQESLVDVRVDRHVGVIKMMSPPANALSYPLIEQLDAAVTSALAEQARVIVFTSGLDRFFAAGADLKMLVDATSSDFANYLVAIRGMIERVAALPQLTIAALDGMALGGGLELALACTMRVASPKVLLGVPEIKLGLLPGAGGTQRLTRLVGRGAALDLVLTGRSIDGQAAHEIGLVDRLGNDVDGDALDLARSLANGPSEALATIVRCVDAATDLPFAEGMEVELEAVKHLFGTAHAREGIAAFIEKRKPDFT